MIEKYWLEFSKIYARLMRLELTIKKKAFLAVKNYYGENALDVFCKFFNNKRRLKRYANDRRNKLSYIINHQGFSKLEKMQKLLNELYLSDSLHFVLKTTQFKNPTIDNLFYNKIPEKYKTLEDCINNLTKLRNCIAHYNFNLYKENKRNFLDSLFLFEVHLGHNVAGISELPKIETPTIRKIVEKIYELKPELIINLNIKEKQEKIYCNHQRMLLSLFDDIAIYNGISANNLPSPWTVLRELYRQKSKIKDSEKKKELFQLSLFK